ncbi:transcriptional repressor [Nakamurella silvestris]|nr:transcriptional repressor [Nakamurella silvestris]
METLAQRLVHRGWRMTAQRRVIAGVFDNTTGPGGDDHQVDGHGADRHHDHHTHLTADEVHELSAAVLPEISRATVYNVLGEMVDAGELLAVNVGDRITRYDPNVHESHDHMVCNGCGSIFDIPAGPPPAPTGHADFLVESADVIYRGRCADCR